MIRRLMIAALVLLTFVANAEARNDTYYLPNAAVVSDPGFGQLGNKVALYFADQTPPKVAQNLGAFVGNNIAKTRGESDEQWCKEAALGALGELRDEAISRGGDAVINIQSSWKGNPIADKTKYECHAGGTGGHISLEGTIVKRAK
ncbi:MAG: hypothetical protein ACLQBA_19355 [Candidatus Binataceae bacterium]